MDPQALEDWLVAASAPPSSNSQSQKHAPGPVPDARQVAEAWGKVRACVQQGSLDFSHGEALSLLDHQHKSIHVADSHVKLLLAILNAVRCDNVELLGQARASSTRVLSAWVRKTFLNTTAKPLKQAEDLLIVLFEGACNSLQERPVSDAYLGQTILLLGLICTLPHINNSQRDQCQNAISMELLARKHVIVRSELSVVLAGVGYAMTAVNGSSSVLSGVLSLWSSDNEGLDPIGVQGPPLRGALMIFHLLEYLGVVMCSKNSIHALAVLRAVVIEIAQKISGISPLPAQCAAVMAAAGLRRGLIQRKTGGSNSPVEQEMQRLIVSLEMEVIRTCEDAMKHLEQLKRYSTPGDIRWKTSESALRHRHRCIALALARSRGFPCHPSILQCLAVTLLTDVLSLHDVYCAQIEDLKRPLQDVHQFGSALGFAMERLGFLVDSSLFHEVGAIALAMCEQYKSAPEEYQDRAEFLVWQFTQHMYVGHRACTVLGGRSLGNSETVEKVLISSFMTVLVFFLRAIDSKPVTQAGNPVTAEKAARALDSLACVEFCRRVRLKDYGNLVERCISYLSARPSAARMFVGFLPPYNSVVNWPGPSEMNNMAYDWSRDEVQTSRLSFYLRVMPSLLSNIPEATFSNDIAPLMFLCLQHPTELVTNAAHALFAHFLGLESLEDPSSARPDTYGPEPAEANLREKLSIYYVTRALETFPGMTPFDALVYGVAAVSKSLPPGSPATLHCINLLVQKASTLKPMSPSVARQKGVQTQADKDLDDLGDAEKLQLLLLHLIRRVDLQVLPELLRQTAQLILGLPPHSRTAALQNAFEVVAGSSDYMRKPIVVPWLQSVAYLATHPNALTPTSKKESATEASNSTPPAEASQGSVSIHPSTGFMAHRGASVHQQPLHSCL